MPAPCSVWLANHCSARGAGLKAGQVITSGSCTGMLFASQGTAVHVEIGGLAPLAHVVLSSPTRTPQEWK